MKHLPMVLLCVAVIALIGGCAKERVTDMRAEDERMIRESEIAASNALAAKDLDRFVSFYADDSSLLFDNSPIITGKDGVREKWRAILARPGFAMSFQPLKVEASRSGDLAYVHGSYELTVNDAAGKPVTDKGKYVVVYKRQPDGKWKIILDTGNSDLAD